MNAPRRVLVANVGVDTVALSPAPNGSDLTSSDVRRLAALVVGDVRGTARVTWIPKSALPDLEAAAREQRIVVVRRGRRAERGADVVVKDAPKAPAVAGLHACAGAVCRVPGCREAS